MKIRSLLFTLIMANVSLSVNAASVDFEELDVDGLNGIVPLVDGPTGGLTPSDSDRYQVLSNEGLQSGVGRNPWEGSVHDGADYGAVGGGGFVEFTFGTAQNALSLLWGSPDDYNDLTLILSSDGNVLELNGSEVFGTPGRLASFVTITDVLFNRLTLSSGRAAFEFANLRVGDALQARPNEVPLPGAVWLFLSAIGGAGLIKRFKRRA